MKNGIIYHRNITSALFVVELDDSTYTVFESFNIGQFNVGDRIAGTLLQVGSIEVLNANTQKTETVIVRQVNISQAEAMDYANLK